MKPRITLIEYELTDGGRKLVPLINALGYWFEDLQRQREQAPLTGSI